MEKEYVLEWPPTTDQVIDDFAPTRKRRKVSEEPLESSQDLLSASQGDVDVDLIENCSAQVSTASLLAKWWKRNREMVEDDQSFCLPESKNPNTMIHHITKQVSKIIMHK